jgi:hypothetical protein
VASNGVAIISINYHGYCVEKFVGDFELINWDAYPHKEFQVCHNCHLVMKLIFYCLGPRGKSCCRMDTYIPSMASFLLVQDKQVTK